jgi:hypothetical protein
MIITAENKGFYHRSHYKLASFGGQRSIQLSYGCFGVYLADWPGLGNGPAGLGGGRSKAPKAKVTRSNRVGCARKGYARSAGTVAG